MRNRTFPKENQKKLNEIIRDLRSKLKQNEKEIKFLREEVSNLMKPVRNRKTNTVPKKMEFEEWRLDFLRRHKRDVLGEKE